MFQCRFTGVPRAVASEATDAQSAEFTHAD
jgi:hypothetical protein